MTYTTTIPAGPLTPPGVRPGRQPDSSAAASTGPALSRPVPWRALASRPGPGHGPAYTCAGCEMPLPHAIVEGQAFGAGRRSAGKGTSGMPCFGARVSDAQVADLQAYIATLPTTGRLGAERPSGPFAPRGGRGRRWGRRSR